MTGGLLELAQGEVIRMQRRTVDKELQLILCYAREGLDGPIQNLGPHRLEPGNMLFAQVTEGGDVPSVDDRHEI